MISLTARVSRRVDPGGDKPLRSRPTTTSESNPLGCRSDPQHTVVRRDEQRRTILAKLAVCRTVARIKQPKLLPIRREYAHPAWDSREQVAMRINSHSVASSWLALELPRIEQLAALAQRAIRLEFERHDYMARLMRICNV